MTESTTPLVSVVLTSYNYGAYVGSAIASVLGQTYEPIEIVVVDDGSTDDSRAVIESFGSRVSPIFVERRGFAAALNSGVAAAHGEIVCLLDADDRFLPTKVARIVELFGMEPSIGACFHARVVEDTEGARRDIPLGISGVHDLSEALKKGRPPFVATVTSALSFRRALLTQILPLPENVGIGVSDHALKFGSLALAPVLFADEVLAVQLTHGRNAYTGTHSDTRVAEVLLRNAAWIEHRFPGLRRLRDQLLLEALLLRAGPKELSDGLVQGLSSVERARLRARVAVARTRRRVRGIPAHR